MGPGRWSRSVSAHRHYWCVGACCWDVLEAYAVPTYTPVFCPLRCVSSHAFFYTGERCQAMQVHGSVLGLMIGGTAGVVFLTFTIISILSQKPRQWPACLLTSARPKKILLHSHLPRLCWEQFGVVFIILVSNRRARTKASSLLCDPYGFSAPIPHMVLLPHCVLQMYILCPATALITLLCKSLV